MATTQQGNQQEEIDRHKRDALDALLTEQVIHILGKPAGLHKVQVRQVGERLSTKRGRLKYAEPSAT
jgi:hypothetical protein